MYHAIIEKLAAEYFESGRFEKEIDSACRLIEPYLEKDPTAFFSLEESQMGCQELKAFCMDRTSSVRKQLNDSI